MAITTRNSAQVAAVLATPTQVLQPHEARNDVKEVIGFVTNAADDSATSVHRFCRVPSNARVTSIMLSTGDASSAGNVHVGLYRTEEDGGAVVDADLFATAFDLTNGPYTDFPIMDSAQYTPAKQAMPLWQALGLAEDPRVEYDVAFTISTNYNGAAVGQLLKVRFVL